LSGLIAGTIAGIGETIRLGLIVRIDMVIAGIMGTQETMG
jgi:phage shock protein PspC (stress-responsive transcriptional regulator)